MLLDAKITDNNVSPSLKEDIIHGPLVHLGKHLFIISRCEDEYSLFHETRQANMTAKKL